MKNCTHCKHAEWKRTDAGRTLEEIEAVEAAA